MIKNFGKKSSVLVFLFSIAACNFANQTDNNISPVLNQSPSSLSSSSPSPAYDQSEKIAFMSNRSGFWDIYTMNKDGSAQQKLTNDDMKSPYSFSVSGDGKKIAYISDKSGKPDLWVMELDTKKTIQMTNTELAQEGSPTWTSESDNVLFHSNIDDTGTYEILEISYPPESDNPEIRKIVSEKGMWALHPSFSPDGSRLLYSLGEAEKDSNLHVYDFILKEDMILTEVEEGAVSGSWFPDSKKIIYWTNTNGIFIADIKSKDKIRVGTIKNIIGSPAISPDSSKIAIARGFGFPENYNIWKLDIDGRNPEQLTEKGGISLDWYKNSLSDNPSFNSPEPVITASPYISPSPSSSGNAYIDPNDPLINP